ncbi:MAG: TonB-dependent receptor plug domain-containing protein, partial [Polaribacter sp.]|nr:TonB-dependent receptor plug domain-containing protein [Polaribacter sp.]
MKKLVSSICILAIGLIGTSAYAQEKGIELDEVVISATKFNLKKEHTGKIIYVISQKDIQNAAGKSVIALLNNIPGVEIKGSNSNASEVRGTYVRGGRSRQVLVLIDGVPVSDPTGVSQEYDLRMLSLNQIESIEVLKGASSALYGSGAATGVINILLKKAAKNKISAMYEVSLGTHNSSKISTARLLDRNQNVSVNGTLNKLNYLAYFSVSGIDGMSAAKSTSNSSFSNDPFYSKSGLFKVGYQASNKLAIETFLNYDEFEYTYDAGAYNDSEINNGTQQQVRFGIKPSFKYNGGEVYVLASVNDLNRTLYSYNSYAKAINAFDFKGKSIHVDLVHKRTFSENSFQLITGLNYQKHDNNTTSDFGNINSDVANFNTVDPYASLVYISNFGFNTSVGARYNMHSEYGNHMVYDASVSYG